MGCGSSFQRGPAFRDVYQVQQKLGMGSYGVVHKVFHMATGQVLAVKMIDRAMSTPKEIKAEINIMKMLDHPHVNRIVEKFSDQYFVYIVTDIYVGGDLMDGMQRYIRENKCRIPQEVLQHVLMQLIDAVAYVHKLEVIHRDVKGDNYLLDRADLSDPKCKVVLTDFGSATTLKKGGRLKEPTGTETYWAPECIMRNYDHLIDVWALGFVLYGLIDGKYPYLSHASVLRDDLRQPSGATGTLWQMLQSMLCKDWKKRPHAQDLLHHPFLTETIPPPIDVTPKPEGSASICFNSFGEQLKEEVDLGVTHWRNHMLNLLEKDHIHTLIRNSPRNESTIEPVEARTAVHNINDLVVEGTQPGEKQHYEWWSLETCKEKKVEGWEASSDYVALDEDESSLLAQSPEALKEMLKKHGIDVSQFGRGEARTESDFLRECLRGEATLGLVQGKLQRVVNVVLLRVRASPGGEVLVEHKQKYEDGRARVCNRLPGAKRRPHESPMATTLQILSTVLNISREEVQFSGTWEMVKDQGESSSFPGVQTLYRKHLAECTLNPDLSQTRKAELGLPNNEFETCVEGEGVSCWKWQTEKKCKSLGISLYGSTEESSFTAPAPAPVLTNTGGIEELKTRLESAGIDVSLFGVGEATSLEEFANELSRGVSTLVDVGLSSTIPSERKPLSVSVLRLVRGVAVRLLDPTTDRILVMTFEELPDGRTKDAHRLPGCLQRTHENPFHAAWRLVTTTLQISDHQVSFSPNCEQLEEEQESSSYPGLKTLYRKQIISGVLGHTQAQGTLTCGLANSSGG